VSAPDNLFSVLRNPSGKQSAVDRCVRGLKSRLLTTVLCVLTLSLSTTTPVLASGPSDATSVAVDVLVARPISLAATVVGSALFVVSLPIAAASRSTKDTAATLVVGPARDLFTRPIGDLQDFLSY
jgi:hypothetical protein